MTLAWPPFNSYFKKRVFALMGKYPFLYSDLSHDKSWQPHHFQLECDNFTSLS